MTFSCGNLPTNNFTVILNVSKQLGNGTIDSKVIRPCFMVKSPGIFIGRRGQNLRSLQERSGSFIYSDNNGRLVVSSI